jgi:hypothetical protein
LLLLLVMEDSPFIETQAIPESVEKLIKIAEKVTPPDGMEPSEFQKDLKQFVATINPEAAEKLVEHYFIIKNMYLNNELNAKVIAGLSPADMLVGSLYDAHLEGKQGTMIGLPDQLMAGLKGKIAREKLNNHTIKL